MRQRASLIVVALLASVGLLAGCAASGGAAPAAPPTAGPEATAATVEPTVAPASDAEARARVDGWIEAVELPPSARREPADPGTAPSLALQSQGWWCEPTVTATAWWSVDGMTVGEGHRWLQQHPTAELVPTGVEPTIIDEDVDAASLGHVPSLESLEGVGFTIARSDAGVVVRAEAGAIPDGAACPSPEPGVALGGPGQG